MAPGVVFGFELAGKWRNGPEDEPGPTYYIGRTRQALLLRDDVSAAHELQLEMVRDRLKFRGLNKPRAMLFWVRTNNVRKTWWDLTEDLQGRINYGGPGGVDRFPYVRQQLYLGDNFFMFGPQVSLEELRAHFGEVLSRAVFDVELMSTPAVPEIEHVGRMSAAAARPQRPAEIARQLLGAT